MKAIAALLTGALFGAGLVISGMTDPHKVLAFLTLDASWDPALIFVMGAAVMVGLVGFQIARRLPRPLLDAAFHGPTNSVIDARLLSGAGIFGLGWGIAGYCPGPALVGFFTLDARALLFVAAYVLGVVLYERWQAAPLAAVDG